ncbi:hypothetical protein Lfu02_15790 [Longispora fulva]|uniref:Uncharacterized protein n=1 Tax=Longispora fulva TaxID=619741 RepID=A0A8J7KT74_9ACTN|nr:hypothetical protein [Longispora fulva]MBG6140412.1 hypothetical protein [Longispora fulva]GIG57207.1 hypothetical protein Lfu02_15790 [Longispora fulva]
MTDSPPAPLKPSSAAILVGIGFAWLFALLWVLRVTLTESGGADSGLISAAQNLFPLVTAILAAGASAGMLAVATLRFASTGLRRLAAGAGAGLLFGVLAGGLALAMIRDTRSSAVIAVCSAAAALVGGLFAAINPIRVVAAGVAGTYAAFLTKVILSIFLQKFTQEAGPEKSFFTSHWMLLIFGVVSGIVAGVVSFRYLRRGPAQHWAGYLPAGAVAGALAILSEGFAWLTVPRLVAPVTDATFTEALLATDIGPRVNSGIALLFAGAVTATILVGRTMRPATEESAEAPARAVFPADADQPEPVSVFGTPLPKADAAGGREQRSE